MTAAARLAALDSLPADELCRLAEIALAALVDVMNLTVNETLSRTIMTAVATALALAALLVLGGDVIRGFVFAMLWGVFVGCYSTIYVAKNIVLWLGVRRDWTKPAKAAPGEKSELAGTPFQDMP